MLIFWKMYCTVLEIKCQLKSQNLSEPTSFSPLKFPLSEYEHM